MARPDGMIRRVVLRVAHAAIGEHFWRLHRGAVCLRCDCGVSTMPSGDARSGAGVPRPGEHPSAPRHHHDR